MIIMIIIIVIVIISVIVITIIIVVVIIIMRLRGIWVSSGRSSCVWEASGCHLGGIWGGLDSQGVPRGIWSIWAHKSDATLEPFAFF